jgi:DNA-binding transcriptional LysR family regulator
MLLVCSPALLAQRPLERIADVVQFPHLHHFQVPDAWAEFSAAHGLPQGATPRIVRCEFYSTLIKCAAAGMGLGLVPSVWVQDELARGELVNALALSFNSRYGYYFVIPEHKQSNPALAMFRAWLQEQAQSTLGQAEATEAMPDEDD